MAITFKHASLVSGMATDSARTDSFGLSLTVLPKQTGKNSVCELLSAINTNPGDVFFSLALSPSLELYTNAEKS